MSYSHRAASTHRNRPKNGSTPTYRHTHKTHSSTIPHDTLQHRTHSIPLDHPPDAATRHTSKQYFKIIQAIHNKEIMDIALSTGTLPPGMTRQIHRLTDFIKPSTPTIETRNRIQENTKQWMNNTISILHQHYAYTISSIPIAPLNTIAVQIATGWAQKRYGSRLTTTTLQTDNQIIPPLQHNSKTQLEVHQPII